MAPRAEAFIDSVLLWHSKHFPHTLSRMQTWLILVSDANLQHLDRMTIAVAILPHILYRLEQIMEDIYRQVHEEVDETRPAGTITEVCNCLCYTSWSAFVFNSIMAISTVRSTPGLVAKVMVATDLCIESLLCWMAKLLFFELLRLVIYEMFDHQKFLWLFDPILVVVLEEEVFDED